MNNFPDQYAPDGSPSDYGQGRRYGGSGLSGSISDYRQPPSESSQAGSGEIGLEIPTKPVYQDRSTPVTSYQFAGLNQPGATTLPTHSFDGIREPKLDEQYQAGGGQYPATANSASSDPYAQPARPYQNNPYAMQQYQASGQTGQYQPLPGAGSPNSSTGFPGKFNSMELATDPVVSDSSRARRVRHDDLGQQLAEPSEPVAARSQTPFNYPTSQPTSPLAGMNFAERNSSCPTPPSHAAEPYDAAAPSYSSAPEGNAAPNSVSGLNNFGDASPNPSYSSYLDNFPSRAEMLGAPKISRLEDTQGNLLDRDGRIMFNDFPAQPGSSTPEQLALAALRPQIEANDHIRKYFKPKLPKVSVPRAISDMQFKELAVGSLAKPIYILSIILAGCAAASRIISGFAQNLTAGILDSIVAILGAIVFIALVRFALEFFINSAKDREVQIAQEKAAVKALVTATTTGVIPVLGADGLPVTKTEPYTDAKQAQ